MNFTNSKEVCAIIKACVNSRVKELSLGNLKIVFESSLVAAIPHPAPVIGQAQTIQQVDQQTLEQLESLVKEDQIDQMLIEDPLEFERLSAIGEFEGEDGNAEDRRTE